MIFLKLKDSDIEFIHYMPFDTEHGLGKTAEELLQEGILVDSLPEPENIVGKNAILKYDKNTNSLYYEYVDRPLTPEEELQQLKERIQIMQQALDDLLLGGM